MPRWQKPKPAQPSLFDPPAQQHSPTSVEAAKQVAPVAGALRQAVYDAIRASGKHGATDEELQALLMMNPSTQRPRRIELVESGQVKDSGLTRKTLAGRSAVVWIAVEVA